MSDASFRFRTVELSFEVWSLNSLVRHWIVSLDTASGLVSMMRKFLELSYVGREF